MQLDFDIAPMGLCNRTLRKLLSRRQWNTFRAPVVERCAGAGGAPGPQWGECMRLVSRASSQLKANEIEAAIATSRLVLEGIAIVYATQSGVELPPRRSMRERLKELHGRIGTAWPEDAEVGELLTALDAAAWAWTSPEHHDDSRIPRREEAAFAVSLTADLLTHAGHLLQAHPEPLKAKATSQAATNGQT